MKIFIAADIEGCACVANKDIWIKNSPECMQAQRQLTREVNAAIEGAYAGGATEVIVCDQHSNGCGNYILEELDTRAQYMFGDSPVSRFPTLENGGYAGAMFLAYHAMEGTHNACMDDGFVDTINGVKVGELGVDAGVAGMFGIPAILVTGDDKICNEAVSLLGPEIETAQVKQSFEQFHILSLSPKMACDLIRQKALAAMGKIGKVKPLNWGSPVIVVKTFENAHKADDAMYKMPEAKRLAERTVQYILKDADEIWKMMRSGRM